MSSNYERLVRQERYPEALRLVCGYFALDCGRVSFHKKAYPGAKAITTSNNKVSIYPAAFDFNGNPHPGWLGSIIGHELVHVGQSVARR
jgi:hypothetical protein